MSTAVSAAHAMTMRGGVVGVARAASVMRERGGRQDAECGERECDVECAIARFSGVRATPMKHAQSITPAVAAA